MLKAADSETGEILGIVCWHRYNNGFVGNPVEMGHADSCPEALNIKMYRAILDGITEKRKEWTGSGSMLFLTMLKVREPYRRRGAGGALIRWGIEQAAKEGAPAYVEAAPEAVSVYEKNGFQLVEQVTASIKDPGIEYPVMRMKA